MRIITLLPAGTEIVAALGGAAQLVGISHQCDYPGSVLQLPRVTTTSVDPNWSGAQIDREVHRLKGAALPVIAVDAVQLRRLQPDLIITQDLCEVCAVSDGEVYRLTEALDPAPRILALKGRDLSGIWDDIRTVGGAIDLTPVAEELVLQLQRRLQSLRSSRPASQPRVLCIEWLEPLYLAGHWVPDLVEAAGGVDVGARARTHSTIREWSELPLLRPDHVIVMLCGFGTERAREELDGLDHPKARELLGRVPTWIIDGNQYTSRPGPRLVDGAERIHALLHGIRASEVDQWRPAVPC